MKKQAKKNTTALRKFKESTKTLRKMKLSNKKKLDALWDMERDGVTYSSMSKFLNCRERFRLSQVEGWSSNNVSVPLEFGNLFHLYAEAQIHRFSEKEMIRIGMKYADKRLSGVADADTIADMQRLVAVSFVTFDEYTKYWDRTPSMHHSGVNHFESGFDWVAKEDQFDERHQVPVLLSSREVRCRGKIDGVFRLNKKTPNLWVMENKTKGDIDVDGIKGGLTKDLQTGFYMLNVWKKYNRLPDGVLYNVIRRTGLRPRVSESASQFADRVRDDIQNRPEWYFMRWKVEITKQDLVDFQNKMLNPILYQMITWWDSVKKNPFAPHLLHDDDGNPIGPNPHHYERPFGCYDGMMHHQRGDYFEIICNNNYHQFHQREFAFPELDSDMTALDQYLE